MAKTFPPLNSCRKKETNIRDYTTQFCPTYFPTKGTRLTHSMELKRAGLKLWMEFNSLGPILQLLKYPPVNGD